MKPQSAGDASKASPYCQAGNWYWPSRRTDRSGTVAMMRPFTRIELRNSRRNARSWRMNRQPLSQAVKKVGSAQPGGTGAGLSRWSASADAEEH